MNCGHSADFFRFFNLSLAGLGLGVATVVQADIPAENSTVDAMAWLQRIVTSARTLPYTGVFVHHTPEVMSSVRITHLVDRAGVEHEKIEPLDGPPQEIIRRNEEMFCYRPDSRTIRIDRRASGRFFPSLISGNPQTLAENYQIKLGRRERIGGHECQWIILEPRDTLRYLHKLCAELQSGLLLRASMFNERKQLIEQFTFTQLALGQDVARQAMKSRYNTDNFSGWRKDYAVMPQPDPADLIKWQISNLPAGFRKVMEMTRQLAGRPQPVSQIVFSDGLAHVSVFVEQTRGALSVSPQSKGEGPTSFALRGVADYQVTVMGEVPIMAVQHIADGVTRRLPH